MSQQVAVNIVSPPAVVVNMNGDEIAIAVTDAPDIAVAVQDVSVVVSIASGIPGPPGPPGPAGGSVVDYEAGENLSSGRVVVIDGGLAFYFQHTEVSHAGRAFGVTTTSATAGNDVSIQVSGVRSDAAFTFTADRPVWVGADGEIFDSVPAGGRLVQKAGVAAEADKILIDFSIQMIKI